MASTTPTPARRQQLPPGLTRRRNTGAASRLRGGTAEAKSRILARAENFASRSLAELADSAEADSANFRAFFRARATGKSAMLTESNYNGNTVQ